PLRPRLRAVARVLRRYWLREAVAARRARRPALRRRLLHAARYRRAGLARESDDHVRGYRSRSVLGRAGREGLAGLVARREGSAADRFSLGPRNPPDRPRRRVLARAAGGRGIVAIDCPVVSPFGLRRFIAAFA